MKKFTDKLNESLNDTSSKTKQMLDYLKNSIKTIDSSIQDYENKSITEEELKAKLKQILQDNIEEEEVCLQEISRRSKKGLNESVSSNEIPTAVEFLQKFNQKYN